jgi:hypothetical protein
MDDRWPDRWPVRLVADTRLRGVAGPLPARTYWPSRGDTPAGSAPLVVFLPAAGIDGTDRLCRAVCSSAGLVVMCVSDRKPAWPHGRCDAILAAGWAADHAGELARRLTISCSLVTARAPCWR